MARKWVIEGRDYMDDFAPYFLPGEFNSQEQAEAAARKRAEQQERRTGWFPDPLFTVSPDGERHAVT